MPIVYVLVFGVMLSLLSSVSAFGDTILFSPMASPDEQFGRAVAIDDTRILVSSKERVYLFDRFSGELLMTFSNPHSTGGTGFGYSIAFVRSDILIGSQFDGDILPAGVHAGAAFLFSGQDGSLLQTFYPPTRKPNQRFGFAVGAFCENILVGSPYYDESFDKQNSGKAYLFRSDGSLAGEFHELIPSSMSRFGYIVTEVNGKVLVGSPYAVPIWEPGENTGRVTLYDSITSDALEPLILDPDPGIEHYFGYGGVVGAGQNVYVGSPYNNIAYMFDASSGALVRSFASPYPASEDSFAWAIAGDQENVLIGSLSSVGRRIYIYESSTGTLQRMFVDPSETDSDDHYYSQTAVMTGLAIVGAPMYDTEDGENAGAVYILTGLIDSPPPPASVCSMPIAALDHFQCHSANGQYVRRDIHTLDEFGSRMTTLRSAKQYCYPVDKNNEGIINRSGELVCYQARDASGELFLARTVNIMNQFGFQTLQISRSRSLCVPSTTSQPVLDHFRCYSARGDFTPREVVLNGPFGISSVSVIRAEQYCTPTDKNGEGVHNVSARLVCYKVRSNDPTRRAQTVESQFGPETLSVKQSKLLCVPSSTP